MKVWVVRLFAAFCSMMIGFELIASVVCKSALVLEALFLVQSIRALKIIEPPSVRLTTKNSQNQTGPFPSLHSLASASTPSAPSAPVPLFSTLSLSSDPVQAPVFGQTTPLTSSLFDSVNHAASGLASPGEEMDWDPIFPSGTKMDSNVHLRPQRFFPPEKPTGLESLLEKTKLEDEQMMGVESQGGARSGTRIIFGVKWRGWTKRRSIMFGVLGVLGCLVALWAAQSGRFASQRASNVVLEDATVTIDLPPIPPIKTSR